MADQIIAGLTILEIWLFIKEWKSIKKEDPLKEVKRDLLIIEILMIVLINSFCLPGVLIYFGI